MAIRPRTALSSTRSRRASKPSRIVIDGAAHAAATSARINSRPAPSPPTWAMRERLCAASKPSAKPPSAMRSKRTPSRASFAIASGAARAKRSTIAASQSPSPAAIVSKACSAGLSSAPSAAAIPPCAQSVEPSAPSGTFERTTTGRGASSSAVISPATPAPTMTGCPR